MGGKPPQGPGGGRETHADPSPTPLAPPSSSHALQRHFHPLHPSQACVAVAPLLPPRRARLAPPRASWRMERAPHPPALRGGGFSILLLPPHPCVS